jgi:hypothetical protein
MAAAMGGSNAPTIMKTIVRRSHAKTSGDHTVRDHEERRHGMLTDLSADIGDYGDTLFSFSHEHSFQILPCRESTVTLDEALVRQSSSTHDWSAVGGPRLLLTTLQ